MLSVIIPTYQKRLSLKDLLESLKNQTDNNFKVIIVNNNTDKDSVTFIEELCLPYQDFFELKILSPMKNLGAGGGRNLGSKQADTSLLAFTDDDCTPHSTWIEVIKKAFQNNDTKVIFGKVTSQVAPLPPFIHGFDMQGGVFGSGNCAFRKDFFEQIGGFDTFLNNWAEDFEIGEKCKALGATPLYIEQMLVEHPPRLQKYFVRNHLLQETFFKKYFYITDVLNYKYKSSFLKDSMLSGLKKAALASLALSLGQLHPALYFSPFIIFSLFQIRKYSRIQIATKSYPFQESFSQFNFLKYSLIYWVIDIINTFIIIYYLIFKKNALKKRVKQETLTSQ